MDGEQLAAFIQQQVQAALLANGGGGGAPVYKPPKPDTFSATKTSANVDLWLFMMEEYMEATNMHGDERKIMEAATYLRGPALTWWRTIKQGPPEQRIINWALWKESFRNTFKPINSAKVARDKLAALRQDTSVRLYATEFRNIALDIPSITDDEKLDKFLRGLKRKTREQVELKEPATFDEAVRLAERFDTLAWRYGDSDTPTAMAANYTGPAPMQLGAISTAPPTETKTRLTPALREQLRKEGKCYYCREAGHVLADCPLRKNTTKPNGHLGAITIPATAAIRSAPMTIGGLNTIYSWHDCRTGQPIENGDSDDESID